MRIPAGPWAVAAGMASGAFGGLVGNQGGIRAAALLHFGLSPAATVATATGIALAVDAARIPIYLATGGAVIADNWPYVVVGAMGVVVGHAAGHAHPPPPAGGHVPPVRVHRGRRRWACS